MKHLAAVLLLGALAGAPAVSRAQSYDNAHQIKASQAKDFAWPTYKKGGAQSKAKVMALQYLLRNRGFYKSKVDGVFGDQTVAAARNFQRAKGLTADGVVGPQTWPVLLLRLRKGDRGDAVRALQIALRGVTGATGGPDAHVFIGQETDGVFGASTRKNVLKYQKYWNDDVLRTVDGVIGPRTWGALLGADFGDQH